MEIAKLENQLLRNNFLFSHFLDDCLAPFSSLSFLVFIFLFWKKEIIFNLSAVGLLHEKNVKKSYKEADKRNARSWKLERWRRWISAHIKPEISLWFRQHSIYNRLSRWRWKKEMKWNEEKKISVNCVYVVWKRMGDGDVEKEEAGAWTNSSNSNSKKKLFTFTSFACFSQISKNVYNKFFYCDTWVIYKSFVRNQEQADLKTFVDERWGKAAHSSCKHSISLIWLIVCAFISLTLLRCFQKTVRIEIEWKKSASCHHLPVSSDNFKLQTKFSPRWWRKIETSASVISRQLKLFYETFFFIYNLQMFKMDYKIIFKR